MTFRDLQALNAHLFIMTDFLVKPNPIYSECLHSIILAAMDYWYQTTFMAAAERSQA